MKVGVFLSAFHREALLIGIEPVDMAGAERTGHLGRFRTSVIYCRRISLEDTFCLTSLTSVD